MAKQTIPIRLICVDPPATPAGFQTVEFGLQDKNQQLFIGDEVSFTRYHYNFSLDVEDDILNFTGVFAHGDRKNRFLYLTLKGLQDGGDWQIIKRIKIPLKTITPEQVRTVLDSAEKLLEVMVSGQGAATVPLLGDGWIVAER